VEKHRIQHIMADHLWRRRNGWTFQFNVPKAFLNTDGATPFRISLGTLSATEAERRARILAGYATATMGGENTSRETVNRGLAEVAAQLADLKAKATSAKGRRAGVRDAGDAAGIRLTIQGLPPASTVTLPPINPVSTRLPSCLVRRSALPTTTPCRRASSPFQKMDSRASPRTRQWHHRLSDFNGGLRRSWIGVSARR
jgi:hypothetical protein